MSRPTYNHCVHGACVAELCLECEDFCREYETYTSSLLLKLDADFVDVPITWLMNLTMHVKGASSEK